MVVILAPGESRQKITLGLIFFSVFLDLPRDSFEIFRSVFITDEGGGGAERSRTCFESFRWEMDSYKGTAW